MILLVRCSSLMLSSRKNDLCARRFFLHINARLDEYEAAQAPQAAQADQAAEPGQEQRRFKRYAVLPEAKIQRAHFRLDGRVARVVCLAAYRDQDLPDWVPERSSLSSLEAKSLLFTLFDPRTIGCGSMGRLGKSVTTDGFSMRWNVKTEGDEDDDGEGGDGGEAPDPANEPGHGDLPEASTRTAFRQPILACHHAVTRSAT